MTEKQQRQLRSTRLSARTRQGKIPHEVEPVEVLTCHGSNAKVCGKLVYLGTLLVPNCSAILQKYTDDVIWLVTFSIRLFMYGTRYQ